MGAAYPSFGCATSITIVAMTQMSRLTCADREIAQPAGSDAQDNPTTVAFPSGSSVMVKMIVEITATSCQKTAPFANLRLTSSARTIVAFPSNGRATLLTIAATVLMNPKPNAKENIANALNPSSVAIMENVFQADGDVVSFKGNQER